MKDAPKAVYRALGLIMDELRSPMDGAPPHVVTWYKVRRDLARLSGKIKLPRRRGRRSKKLTPTRSR